MPKIERAPTRVVAPGATRVDFTAGAGRAEREEAAAAGIEAGAFRELGGGIASIFNAAQAIFNTGRDTNALVMANRAEIQALDRQTALQQKVQQEGNAASFAPESQTIFDETIQQALEEASDRGDVNEDALRRLLEERFQPLRRSSFTQGAKLVTKQAQTALANRVDAFQERHQFTPDVTAAAEEYIGIVQEIDSQAGLTLTTKDANERKVGAAVTLLKARQQFWLNTLEDPAKAAQKMRQELAVFQPLMTPAQNVLLLEAFNENVNAAETMALEFLKFEIETTDMTKEEALERVNNLSAVGLKLDATNVANLVRNRDNSNFAIEDRFERLNEKRLTQQSEAEMETLVSDWLTQFPDEASMIQQVIDNTGMTNKHKIEMMKFARSFSRSRKDAPSDLDAFAALREQADDFPLDIEGFLSNLGAAREQGLMNDTDSQALVNRFFTNRKEAFNKANQHLLSIYNNAKTEGERALATTGPLGFDAESERLKADFRRVMGDAMFNAQSPAYPEFRRDPRGFVNRTLREFNERKKQVVIDRGVEAVVEDYGHLPDVQDMERALLRDKRKRRKDPVRMEKAARALRLLKNGSATFGEEQRNTIRFKSELRPAAQELITTDPELLKTLSPEVLKRLEAQGVIQPEQVGETEEALKPTKGAK